MNTATADTTDREIIIGRVFDAPREMVFEAFVNPKHIGNWWGPKGFTTTTHDMDVRPGGEWRYIMHGPDGTDYQNRIIYIEIKKPERLVYMHSGAKDTVRFHVTVTFEEQGGKTSLTMRSLFETAEERNRVVEKYHAIEGGKHTLGRLADYLAAGKVGAPKGEAE